ncbi:Di-copper centre-containing protein [Trichodelitschia bisporula]|uniref:Di-copper centre-containing protein n=1 Tax=Trichodelitschia bisporula TaxID=703511 RepID=A0A6G1HWI3_9PEZI|nr:Di-copper centre-containing protein [Trichodelitschia bisporula]
MVRVSLSLLLGAVLAVVGAQAPGSAAVPAAVPAVKGAACTTPRLRREWRSLSIPQRQKYLSAMQCMLSAPSKARVHFPPLTNRYEDFVALHINATGGGMNLTNFRGVESLMTSFASAMKMGSNGIHGTGTFLPWHRYAVWTWETALREECGWTEGQPYWDWNIDTKDHNATLKASPVFDPVIGFGGDGVRVARNVSVPAAPPPPKNPMLDWLTANIPGFEMPMFDPAMMGGCVQDGPFKNITLHVGPMGRMISGEKGRCLTRGFNQFIMDSAASKENIRKVLASKDFGEFRVAIEQPRVRFGATNGSFGIVSDGGDLHTIGHGGIGGEMMDVFTSPNDPIFWLHHGNLDRIWSIWQDAAPEKRRYDASNPASFWNTGKISLTTPIWMGFAAPDRPVRAVMDPLNRNGEGFLCYKYETGGEVYYA